MKIRHGNATAVVVAVAAATAAATVGVADPRREGVRSVPSSSASGVLRVWADRCTSSAFRRLRKLTIACDGLNP